MRQIHPERKYLVADVPTYQLKVHSILGILHACCLNPKYECSILEILSATLLSMLGTLITLNTSAHPLFRLLYPEWIPTNTNFRCQPNAGCIIRKGSYWDL
jgi:hypothetical protein